MCLIVEKALMLEDMRSMLQFFDDKIGTGLLDVSLHQPTVDPTTLPRHLIQQKNQAICGEADIRKMPDPRLTRVRGSGELEVKNWEAKKIFCY